MNVTNELLNDVRAELMQCTYDLEVWCRENGASYAIVQKHTIDTMHKTGQVLNECKREIEKTKRNNFRTSS